MTLFEIFDSSAPGYKSQTEDNTVMKLHDLRKSRLTLHDINRLRMANDVRKVEHENKLEQVSKQYKAPVAALGPM